MKRLTLVCLALIGVSAAVVLSGNNNPALRTLFPKEERNPVTHLRWNDDADMFQFAIVSDRTGGHRANVFAQAVEKLNQLQPAFVVSVGDLIEGGKKPDDKLAAEWQEFDGLVQKLQMPFFYVSGNHDVNTKESDKFWQERFGRKHYHFIYRNVLFLVLNSDDPPGTTTGGIGKEQIAWAKKVLTDNAQVRWTIVLIHRPLWTGKNGWTEIENTLKGRSYTVFAGHVHRYEKFVRQGMNYYQLATTGGVSLMRGPEYNEFDHIVWVTMKKEGPILANILLNSVQTENLRPIRTDEPGVSTAKRLPTYPLRGFAYCDGVPMPGAAVTFVSEKGSGKGPTARGIVEADGSFKLSTYKAFDGVPEGNYHISVTWREAGKSNVLPKKYTSADTSGLRASIKAEMNEVTLELKR